MSTETNTRYELEYDFESMRTDWLLMEKERLERESFKEHSSQELNEIDLLQQFIKQELSHRSKGRPLSALEDNQVHQNFDRQ